jgi:hypothetical protein
MGVLVFLEMEGKKTMLAHKTDHQNHAVSWSFPVQTPQVAREDIKESFEMKIDEKHISLFPIFMNSATLY